jgi:hypothetical protein
MLLAIASMILVPKGYKFSQVVKSFTRCDENWQCFNRRRISSLSTQLTDLFEVMTDEDRPLIELMSARKQKRVRDMQSLSLSFSDAKFVNTFHAITLSWKYNLYKDQTLKFLNSDISHLNTKVFITILLLPPCQ